MARTRWSTFTAMAVFLATSCNLVAALGASTPDFTHYHYFKERRILHLDPGQIAILDQGSSSTDRTARFLGDAGYDEPALVRRSVPGWTLFQLSEASGTPGLATGGEAVSQNITRLVDLDREERFFFAPVFTGDFGPIIPSRSILVRFRGDLTEGEIAGALDRFGIAGAKRFAFGNMHNTYKIQTAFRSGIETLRMANQLAVQPEVVAAEPDMMFSGRSALTPNDPNFSVSWGLHNTGQLGGTPDMDIDAPEAWDRTTGSGSSTILTVIIDTGVEQTHPDLHQFPGSDFTSQAGDGGPINVCDNHGTPVAGVVGSTIDNGLGTAGVAPGAWIISARTFISTMDADGNCVGWETFSSWTVDALAWAEVINARVTNNSNFYGFQSSIIASTYQDTRDSKGMVHFASAGNFSIPQVEWPAALPSVHAITAIERSGNRASFSSWGAEVAFTGPGDYITTTDRTGSAGYTSIDYVLNISGTSYSTPMIAGVAALLFSEAYSLDADEVDTLLRSSAVDLGPAGWDQIFGWGLPNAAQALSGLDLFSDDFESGDTSEWSVSKP